jgi:hypothetical protein
VGTSFLSSNVLPIENKVLEYPLNMKKYDKSGYSYVGF